MNVKKTKSSKKIVLKIAMSMTSSLSSQGSNAWVNSFSQGGVRLTGSNYMTPRGEYISRPPCNRVTLQTGTSYPNTDKVIHECILWFEEANPYGSWCRWS